MCLNVPQKIMNISRMHIHPSIHAIALQPKSGLGLHYLLSPQYSIIGGQLPIATTQKSDSILLRHIFPSFLGFPTDLTPPNISLSTFLGIRVPYILCTCLAHWSLFSLIRVTRSGSPYSSYNSLLYLILHWPLSWTEPQIFLNIFLSKILRTFSDFLESAQVSFP
jgi:hypothetical protein